MVVEREGGAVFDSPKPVSGAVGAILGLMFTQSTGHTDTDLSLYSLKSQQQEKAE